MADNAHLVKAPAQEPDAGEGVVPEVLRGAVDDVTGGLAEAAVVIAERGYAGLGKGIGYHRKRFVLIDFLVAVLQAASGDHDENRCLAAATLRQHQRTFQDGIPVGEGNLFLRIREGALRGLRPVQLLLAGRERHGEGDAHLLEGAIDLLQHPLSLIGGSDGRNLDGYLAGFRPLYLHGNAPGALVRGIHSWAFVQMEHQRQLRALHIELAGPCTGLGKGNG